MSDPHPVRMADLLAPLALVTDLGMGQPAEDARWAQSSNAWEDDWLRSGSYRSVASPVGIC